MVEKRIDIVKIQRRGQGSYMVTIPLEVVTDFKLKPHQKMDVYVDKANAKICYKPLE